MIIKLRDHSFHLSVKCGAHSVFWSCGQLFVGPLVSFRTLKLPGEIGINGYKKDAKSHKWSHEGYHRINGYNIRINGYMGTVFSHNWGKKIYSFFMILVLLLMLIFL